MMVYILAGADGTGKSTWMEKAKLHFGNRYKYEKESHTDDEAEKVRRVHKIQKYLNSGVDVIYDRATILDDLIYKPVIEGKESLLNTEAYANILRRCKVLYFSGETREVAKRVFDRGDDYLNCDTIDQLEQVICEIMDKYGKVFDKWGIDYDTFDVFSDAYCNGPFETLAKWPKEMRIAEIVPVSCLELTANNQYHMCLAHLVKQDPTYAAFYRRMSDEGKFVLMDNGAAEGSQLSFGELAECYEIIHPSEIVLSDTLCDSASTLAKFEESGNELDWQRDYRHMAVPQGKDFDEWKKCAAKMFESPSMLDSIGVSKFLEMSTGNPYIRYEAVKFIDDLSKKLNVKVDVHLLGCSEGSEAVRMIHNDFDIVRGCDSAYAYICSQNAEEPIGRHTKRASGEIDFLKGEDVTGLLDVSMECFETACGVNDNGVTSTWEVE